MLSCLHLVFKRNSPLSASLTYIYWNYSTLVKELINFIKCYPNYFVRMKLYKIEKPVISSWNRNKSISAFISIFRYYTFPNNFPPKNFGSYLKIEVFILKILE